MSFTEAVKTLILGLIGSGGIFAYIGFQVKDSHMPLRLFLLSLSTLMPVIAGGIALRSLEEQATGSPTVAQTAIINMANVAYWALLTVFIVVIGYFIILFIKWVLKTMEQRKDVRDKMITE